MTTITTGDLVDQGMVLGACDNHLAVGRCAAHDGGALRDLEDLCFCGHDVYGDQVFHPDVHLPLAIWEELKPKDGVGLHPPCDGWLPVLAVGQAQQHLLFLGTMVQAHDL